jgi:hypothetical protein
MGHRTAAAHETGSGAAQAGAVDIERDASRHHLDIVFLETGAGASVARQCTGVAGIDTALELLVHDELLHVAKEPSWSHVRLPRRASLPKNSADRCPQCSRATCLSIGNECTDNYTMLDS